MVFFTPPSLDYSATDTFDINKQTKIHSLQSTTIISIIPIITPHECNKLMPMLSTQIAKQSGFINYAEADSHIAAVFMTFKFTSKRKTHKKRPDYFRHCPCQMNVTAPIATALLLLMFVISALLVVFFSVVVCSTFYAFSINCLSPIEFLSFASQKTEIDPISSEL